MGVAITVHKLLVFGDGACLIINIKEIAIRFAHFATLLFDECINNLLVRFVNGVHIAIVLLDNFFTLLWLCTLSGGRVCGCLLGVYIDIHEDIVDGGHLLGGIPLFKHCLLYNASLYYIIHAHTLLAAAPILQSGCPHARQHIHVLHITI